MTLELQPLESGEANAFIARYHRHHKPLKVGYLFAIGLNDGEKVVGVSLVGRPVARHLCDGYTAEVRRLCTDGTHNACSMLYAASWRACRAMGYRRLITYILKEEPGTSLRAAGWRLVGMAGGGTWNRPKQGRLRYDNHPTGQKQLWEVRAWFEGTKEGA